MQDMVVEQGVVAIIPCLDIEESAALYARLGFSVESDHGDYRLLKAPGGLRLHLRAGETGWVDPPRNPFGIYIYADDVDRPAEAVADVLIHRLMTTSWGTFEFALSDPNGTLVRVGKPI